MWQGRGADAFLAQDVDMLDYVVSEPTQLVNHGYAGLIEHIDHVNGAELLDMYKSSDLPGYQDVRMAMVRDSCGRRNVERGVACSSLASIQSSQRSLDD